MRLFLFTLVVLLLFTSCSTSPIESPPNGLMSGVSIGVILGTRIAFCRPGGEQAFNCADAQAASPNQISSRFMNVRGEPKLMEALTLYKQKLREEGKSHREISYRETSFILALMFPVTES